MHFWLLRWGQLWYPLPHDHLVPRGERVHQCSLWFFFQGADVYSASLVQGRQWQISHNPHLPNVILRHSDGKMCPDSEILKRRERPWLVWLSGLSSGLQAKRLPVRFPVRVHAWVAARSPVGGVWEAANLTHWCFSPSLFTSLPLSLKVNN